MFSYCFPFFFETGTISKIAKEKKTLLLCMHCIHPAINPSESWINNLRKPTMSPENGTTRNKNNFLFGKALCVRLFSICFNRNDKFHFLLFYLHYLLIRVFSYFFLLICYKLIPQSSFVFQMDCLYMYTSALLLLWSCLKVNFV